MKTKCPFPQEKPIIISIDEIRGECGGFIHPEDITHLTIRVMVRVKANVSYKYANKELTIKDLSEIIKLRQ